jgi:hypothetical protein
MMEIAGARRIMWSLQYLTVERQIKDKTATLRLARLGLISDRAAGGGGYVR